MKWCKVTTIILLLGVVACGERKLKDEIERFIEKEVVVPGGMSQMVEGRDTVLVNPASGAARFVLWVDSLACSTCQVNQMFKYDEIVRFREEAGEGFIPVFVFSPPRTKISEVLLGLEISQFDYPVFLDENQAFPAANPHIPADSRFHTFLLDKNGKVVLVGDPVNNPQLWELYKTTITELIANGGTMPEPETKK